MTEEFLTDDEQLQEVKRLWTEYGSWIAGAVLIATIGVFGYRYYQGHVQTRALEAAQQFSNLSEAYQRNDTAKARQIADLLIDQYSGSPYADQAKLMLARLYLGEDKLDLAQRSLSDVMEHSKDTELRHIARLRIARLQIDQGKADDALKTLSDDPGSFAARYHEVRGDALYAKKDFPKALQEYQAALAVGSGGSDPDAALLTLKIADLGALASSTAPPAAAAPPTASPSPSATAPNKANP